MKTTDVVVRYGSASVDQFIENHAHDVSQGGMFVRSEKPLAEKTLVSFEIRLANEQVVVSGVGRVIWKRDVTEGERPAGMGIKFIDLEEGSQAIVDRLLAAKKGPSEYDRGVPAPVKTVLGLGSPLAGQPVPSFQKPSGAAGPSPARTKLGMASAISPEDAERIATRLGLASPVKPAALVIAEQSSPAVAAPPPAAPARAAPAPTPATSEIDEAWPAEVPEVPKPVEPVAPKQAPALATVIMPETAKAAISAPGPVKSAPPAEVVRPASQPPSRSQPASVRPAPVAREEEEEEEVPRRGGSVWPWLLLLVFVAVGAVYYFRGPLHQRGLIPQLPAPPWLPGAPTPAPPPAVPPPPEEPSAAPSASASEAPSASASAAPSASAATDLAASASASKDTGHAPATAKSAASASSSATAHASASAKPPHKPPPKPKPSDDTEN